MMRVWSEKNAGYTLMGTLVGYVIIGGFTLIAAQTARKMMQNESVIAAYLVRESTANVQQMLTAFGIDPDQVDFLGAAEVERIGSEVSSLSDPDAVVGEVNSTQVTKALGDDRASAYGMRLSTQGAVGASSGSIVLAPPIINYSGIIDSTWFPINNLVSAAASNPFGTQYRYSTSGMPTASSPLWPFSMVFFDSSGGGLALTPFIAVAAFHPDPIYAASIPASVSFALPEINVLYAREDGSASFDFTYHEINDDTNRIVLSNDFSSSFFDVYYATDGSAPNTEYTSPFHVPMANWGETSAELTVLAVSKNIYFNAASSEESMTLNKQTIPLPSTVASYSDTGDSTVEDGGSVDLGLSGPDAVGANVYIEHGLGGAADPSMDSPMGGSVNLDY